MQKNQFFFKRKNVKLMDTNKLFHVYKIFIYIFISQIFMIIFDIVYNNNKFFMDTF